MMATTPYIPIRYGQRKLSMFALYPSSTARAVPLVEAGGDGRWDEHALVAALRRREGSAMAYLYDHYASALFGAITRVVRCEAAAEDLLQETFVRAWLSIDQYKEGRGRLYTWLVRIARNAALDVVKSQRYQHALNSQEIGSIGQSDAAAVATSFNPDTIGVIDVIRKLNAEQEELVELIYIQGYTHVEVSKHLGIPLGTVKTRLRTAIRTIRTLLT